MTLGRLSAVAVVGVAIACNSGTEHDSFLLRDVPAPARIDAWNDEYSSVSFELVEQIGDHPDEPEFGTVEAIDADESGRLLVYDRSDCSMTVLSAARSVEARFGRCGSAPGEFFNISRVVLRADTVMAFELPTSMLTWTTVAGEEIRRVRLATSLDGQALAITVRDDSSVVAGFNSAPRKPDGSDARFLRTMSTLTGEVSEERVLASTAAMAEADRRNESLTICATSEQSPYFVAAQLWLLQTVVFERSTLRAIASYATAGSATGSTRGMLPNGQLGGVEPKLGSVNAVCGRDWYAVTVRLADKTVYPLVELPVRLEIRRYTGELLYRGSNPPGLHPEARVRAAWGNNLVFVTNETVPQISVLRVGTDAR